MFIQIEKGESAYDDDLDRFIVDALDEIEDLVVAGQNAEAAAAAAPAPASSPVQHDAPPAKPARANGDGRSAESAGPASAAAEPPSAPAPAVPARGQAAGAADSYVRVNAEHLDRLLKSAGELHADMLLQNLGSQEIGRLGEDVAALEAEWNRTWKQIEAALRRGDRANLFHVMANGEHFATQMKGCRSG